jgi:hypothetical protein
MAWNAFHDDLRDTFGRHRFRIIVVVVCKPEMQMIYSTPFHPYHYALENIIERTAMESKRFGQTWRVVAEDREKGMNGDLQTEHLRLQFSGCGSGIVQPLSNVNAEEIRRKFDPVIVFRKKPDNDTGIQVADLAAGPITRHVLGLDHHEARTIRDVIIPKLCARRPGRARGFGIKCFPDYPSGCPIT